MSEKQVYTYTIGGSNYSETRQIEIDYTIPAAKFESFKEQYEDLIAGAYAQQTVLDHDMYFEDRGDMFAFHGGDGLVHGLKPDELIYIRFIDLEKKEAQVDRLIRMMSEVQHV